MNRILKFFLGILSAALIATLVIAFLPHISGAVSDILVNGKYVRTASILNEEMKKAGELTTLKFTQDGIMEVTVNAKFVGAVAKSEVPFYYEIGLGIDLAQINLEANDYGITAYVPTPRMLYDKFQVTGDPKAVISLVGISNKDYQKASDQQAAECRASYLNHPSYLDDAWNAACEQLSDLFNTWIGEDVPVTFEKPAENPAAEETPAATATP